MTGMPKRPSRTRRREALFDSCRDAAGMVHCNICGGKVDPARGDDWAESHWPIPKSLGGTATGVAHFRCNAIDGQQNVTPIAAKVKRIKRRHERITGPGLSAKPLPCGKRSRFTKTFHHGVMPRVTQAERHRALMAKRYGDFR